MVTKASGAVFRSKFLLCLFSVLSLYFISGWPARMLFFEKGLGEAGLGLYMAFPFTTFFGFISIPIAFWIVRAIFRMPKLSLLRVFLTSLAATAIGALAFLIPTIIPPLLYGVRVENFKIQPTLLSQSLDKSTQTYHFTLQLDNKTNTIYENVNVGITTGFYHHFPNEALVLNTNHASPRTITLKPGVTSITDSIYLGDCSESSQFRGDDARLTVNLIYDPQDGGYEKYTTKNFVLTPEIEGLDFTKYYTSICNWFTNN